MDHGVWTTCEDFMWTSSDCFGRPFGDSLTCYRQIFFFSTQMTRASWYVWNRGQLCVPNSSNHLKALRFPTPILLRFTNIINIVDFDGGRSKVSFLHQTEPYIYYT